MRATNIVHVVLRIVVLWCSVGAVEPSPNISATVSSANSSLGIHGSADGCMNTTVVWSAGRLCNRSLSSFQGAASFASFRNASADVTNGSCQLQAAMDSVRLGAELPFAVQSGAVAPFGTHYDPSQPYVEWMFNVAGTQADVGTLADPSLTISFSSRFDATSVGFVYAVLDAWVDNTAHTSPLLSAAARNVLSLGNSEVSALWASMAKYSVYSSVLADGGSGSLYYVAYTYPSQQAVIKWDVGRALFDGKWHSVVICFSGENRHLRTVKLYIDGYTTARTRDRWLQCASHFGDAVAHPIRDNPVLQPAFVGSPVESVLSGGLLVLGAINASLFNVQFFPRAFTQEDVIVAGAPWMYRNRPVRKPTGFVIGSVLLVGAVAVCFSIALQVLFEILPSVKAASLQSEAEAAGALIDRAAPTARAVSTTKEACQATVSAAAAASRSIQEPLTSDKILATVPMALGVFQGLSLYFKGWEWPPAFRRWCSYLFSYIAFDLAFWVYTPPYVILLLQAALVFVCAAFVRAMTVRDRKNFGHAVDRYEAARLAQTNFLREAFLKALPDVFHDEALLAKACTAIVSERKDPWTPQRLCGLELAVTPMQASKMLEIIGSPPDNAVDVLLRHASLRSETRLDSRGARELASLLQNAQTVQSMRVVIKKRVVGDADAFWKEFEGLIRAVSPSVSSDVVAAIAAFGGREAAVIPTEHPNALSAIVLEPSDATGLFALTKKLRVSTATEEDARHYSQMMRALDHHARYDKSFTVPLVRLEGEDGCVAEVLHDCAVTRKGGSFCLQSEGRTYDVALVTGDSTLCPVHQCALVPATEEHYRTSTDGACVYRCCHASAYAYKRSRPPCDATQLYVCPRDSCAFAVCVVCADYSWLRRVVVAPLWGSYDQLRRHPETLAYVGVFLALQIIYLPAVENALMVLSCHPNLICQLGAACYSDPNATFVVSLVLSIALLLVVGVGLPALWSLELVQRRLRLNPVVHTPSDWSWFLQFDPSIISGLYRKYEFRYLTLDIFLLAFFKTGQVMAVAFSEPNSLGQLAGVTAVEFVFAGFVVLAKPFEDPWIDVLTQAGSVHQLLQLAWVSFHRGIMEVDPGTTTFRNLMFSTLVAYIIVVAASIYFPIYVPWKKYRALQMARTLDRREREYLLEPVSERKVKFLEQLLSEKMSLYGSAHFQVLLTLSFLRDAQPELNDEHSALASENEADFRSVLAALHTGVATDDGHGALLPFAFHQLVWAEMPLNSLRCVARLLGSHSDTHLLELLMLPVAASRTRPDLDVAASNCISLLCLLQHSFTGLDLSGVRISHACLCDVYFHQVNFRGADLTDVVLDECYFRDCCFDGAAMNGLGAGSAATIEAFAERQLVQDHPSDGAVSDEASGVVRVAEEEHGACWAVLFDGTFDVLDSKLSRISIGAMTDLRPPIPSHSVVTRRRHGGTLALGQ